MKFWWFFWWNSVHQKLLSYYIWVHLYRICNHFDIHLWDFYRPNFDMALHHDSCLYACCQHDSCHLESKRVIFRLDSHELRYCVVMRCQFYGTILSKVLFRLPSSSNCKAIVRWGNKSVCFAQFCLSNLTRNCSFSCVDLPLAKWCKKRSPSKNDLENTSEEVCPLEGKRRFVKIESQTNYNMTHTHTQWNQQDEHTSTTKGP